MLPNSAVYLRVLCMEIIHNKSIFAEAFLYQAQAKNKSQTGSGASQGRGAGEFQNKIRDTCPWRSCQQIIEDICAHSQ